MDETFALAYLVRNTITNLTTQDEQVECFRNAAAHLEPGGCFVIEVYVPELRRLPPGETIHAFDVTPAHLGFEEYDFATQIAYSHHYWTVDGQVETFSAPYRYVWPSELDLMARLAGLSLRAAVGELGTRAVHGGKPEPHLRLGAARVAPCGVPEPTARPPGAVRGPAVPPHR